MAERMVSRRQVLAGLAGLGTTAALASCGSRGTDPQALASAVAKYAASQKPTGQTRHLDLKAQVSDVDLGGKVVKTWIFGENLGRTVLRATAGEQVQIDVHNSLPEPTSVHWHGFRIRNDMDGVPDLTTPAIEIGKPFRYDFVLPDPGTYWFHPHHGMHLDVGLYGVFVVDDPHEPGGYDEEWVVMLDDWTDGIGLKSEEIQRRLTAGETLGGQAVDASPGSTGDMSGMGPGHMGSGGIGGVGWGDIAFPMYLVNGRGPSDPAVLETKPGRRVRLRIVNASADTVFQVAVGGHSMRVTHTDGYPVAPISTQVLRIAMGERYDAVVTLQDGVFPLVAMPMGKRGSARALIRTSPTAAAPPEDLRPAELDGRVLTVGSLTVADGYALPAAKPDVTYDVNLSGSMRPYRWTINKRSYDQVDPFLVKEGQRVRLRMKNHSVMVHPMHLHGHTFQVGAAGGQGARKDTVLVPMAGFVDIDFVADNPGRWMYHCHNAYHAEAGMMTRVDYTF